MADQAQDNTQPTQVPPVATPVSEPEPVQPVPVEEPQMPQTNEAASAMSIPDPIPTSQPPVTDTQTPQNPEPQTVDPEPPAMPEVSAGQILSDNLSSPVNTPSLTQVTDQTFSAEPPAAQSGPVSDVTAEMSAAPNTGIPADAPIPQAPVQKPVDQAQNPLNAVLNDLQSKANS